MGPRRRGATTHVGPLLRRRRRGGLVVVLVRVRVLVALSAPPAPLLLELRPLLFNGVRRPARAEALGDGRPVLAVRVAQLGDQLSQFAFLFARPARPGWPVNGSCESSQKNMRSWLYRGVQRSRRLRALSPEPVFLTNSGLRRLPDRPRVLGGKPVFIRVDVRALYGERGKGTAPTTATRARYFWLAQTAPP